MLIRNNSVAIFLDVIVALFLFIALSVLTISACEAANKKMKQEQSPYVNAEITIKIIPCTKNTFGYDIFLYGNPFIHQPSIPGLPGNDGFTTKEGAQKVADLVVEKIRNNEIPPSVSIEELNSIGVLK